MAHTLTEPDPSSKKKSFSGCYSDEMPEYLRIKNSPIVKS